MIIKIMAGLALMIWPGYLLIKLFFANLIQGRLNTWAYAYVLGWGLVTGQMFIALFWLRLSLGVWLIWLMAAEAVVLSITYLFIKPKLWRQWPVAWKNWLSIIINFKSWPKREQLLLSLIILFVALILANALIQPLVVWDSLVNWSLKAKMLLNYGHLSFVANQAGYWLSWPSPQYPWNVTLSFVWSGLWLGGFSEIANNLLAWGFYVSTLLVIYDFLRRQTARSNALLFTFMAASAELLAYHGFSPYGDLPLACMSAMVLITLLGACQRPTRAFWILAGIFGGLATLTKNEGIFYVLASFGLVWLIVKNLSLRRRLARFGWYVLGLVMMSGWWWIFKLVNHLGVQNTDSGWVWHPETAGYLFKFWFAYGGFNIFWSILLIILIFNWRALRLSRLLALSWLWLAAVGLAFLAVYIFTKSYVFALDGTVILRNSLTFFPAALILTALTFDSKFLRREAVETIGEIEPTLPFWLTAKIRQNKTLFKNRKVVKFIFVGCLGAAIDFGLLALLVEVFHWSPLLANIVSFSAAVINNFCWNKFWTWRDTGLDYHRQFIKFVVTSVIGLLINTGLLWLGLRLGGHYLAVKVVISVVVAFWNYQINNRWTFKLKIHPD